MGATGRRKRNFETKFMMKSADRHIRGAGPGLFAAAGGGRVNGP
jgi:hypothetical protein